MGFQKSTKIEGFEASKSGPSDKIRLGLLETSLVFSGNLQLKSNRLDYESINVTFENFTLPRLLKKANLQKSSARKKV